MTEKFRSTKQKKKVLIALSGGIDSAVSAVLLLKKGYDVEAAFMKNWSSTDGLLLSECPWLEDRREALRVAAFLGIPLHTFDFEKEYRDKVMRYFFEEYAAGRTPNPDVMCNKEIKFKLLYDRAMQMGFNFLATGHYAQIKNGKLLRAKDQFKDQTYFIYNIKPQQLKHLIFPIGGYLKSEVRAMARKFKLPNAERKESMGLCFVGKIQLDRFLQQKIKPKPGKIIDLASGLIIGKHQGIFNYTLGQRTGLGIGGSGPYYVVQKQPATNVLVVSKEFKSPALMINNVLVENLNWLLKPKKFPAKAKARFRHQQELEDVQLELAAKNAINVKFKRLQRAVAPGQSLVLYQGKECIGGGVLI